MFGPLVIAALAFPQSGEKVDAAQFHRLLKAQMEMLRDVSFVCEGEVRYVGPKEATRDELAAFEEKFQAEFICKNNRNLYIDIYHYKHLASVVNRRTSAVLDGRLSRLSVSNPRKPAIHPSPGGIKGVFELGSPLTYYIYPLLQLYENPDDLGFEFEGWQDVGGHRCLVATLRVVSGSDKLKKRYWFDMARGMHPLKAEAYQDDQLIGTLTDVELIQVKGGDGSSVWFPVRAVSSLHTWDGEFLKIPALLISNHVLETSLLVNVGIDDREFDLKRRTSNSPPRGINREWLGILEDNKRPKPRTDPQSIKESLDRTLSEADRQARFLDASASASEENAWSQSWPVGLGVLAMLSLLGAGFLRWRSR